MRVDQAVLAVLSAADISGNAVKLTGQLDRPLYVATDKVLEAAGGKWNLGAKAHLFAGDAAEVLDEVILTGEIDSLKPFHKIADFFPTPEALVRNMIALADLKPGDIVLEPEAGEGAIAKIVAETNPVLCIEKYTRYADKIQIGGNIKMVLIEDFMEFVPAKEITGINEIDVVIMNPPFSKRQDIKHVLHALKFLKPDGRLVAIMSAGVLFRNDKLTQEFRDLVEERGGEIIKNDDGAFKESGTMVSTVTVVIPGEAS